MSRQAQERYLLISLTKRKEIIKCGNTFARREYISNLIAIEDIPAIVDLTERFGNRYSYREQP